MEDQKRQKFSQWFESNFASPQAVLVEYLEELQNKAAEIGAALPADFIQNLSISSVSEQKNYMYLPTFKGINDTKQSAYAFMGETRFKDCEVKVPIVVFCSFKLSIPHSTWAPSKRLIEDFKRSKSVIKYAGRSNKSYSELVKQMEADELVNSKRREILKQKANAAAAELSQAQLRKGLIQTVIEPSDYFGIQGLSRNNWSEFLCSRSVRDMLYIQSKKVWKECYAASPKDLIIPMYDIKKGQLTNLQKIRVLADGKTEKRFLPGGKMLGQCAIISKKSDPNSFIVTEGYKTGRVLDEVGFGTVYCAFAANNVLEIVKGIRELYPLARIYTATDNDVDGKKAADAAYEQFNSIPIPPPTLFKGSDHADLAKEIGIPALTKQLKSYLVTENLIELVDLKLEELAS